MINAKAMWAKLHVSPNPIIVKELRSRMRGWRAFAGLTGMLLLLAGISYLLYRIVLAATRYSNMPVSPQIGQALLIGLAIVELLIICFITPAVTAGSVSSEQEKLTYEMLLTTPLRPASILWGKLLSALSYVLLLIFAAIPMASLVFIFGGVVLKDMIKALIILVVTAITLGVVGIFMSAWLGRTVRATVLSYLVVLGLLVGPLVVYIAVGVLKQTEPPRWLLVPNPVSALLSALSPVTPYGGSLGILGELGRLFGGGVAMMMAKNGGSLTQSIPRPLYHYTLPLYGALSLVLYMLSTRLVRPTRRWRLHWREVLIAVALLLALAGVVAVPFLLTTNRYEGITIPATPTPAPFGPMGMPPVAMERVVAQVVVAVPTEAPIATPVPTPSSAPESTEGETRPTPLPVPLLADPAVLSGEELAEIYAAVIRQMYTVDHTFNEAPNFPIVYLVRMTQDGIGDPDAPKGDPQVLPEAMQTGIVEALADLPAKFVWVDSEAEVPRDGQTQAVADKGAIFTLGNIYRGEERLVHVSAKLYFSMLGGGGRTYVLEQLDGTWQVIGDTGVTWIS